MLRVGLTGGIGAGKSTVARRLAEHGALVLDADAMAREVVAPGTDGLAAVVAAFGPSVLDPTGALDRAALGRIVFADPDARRRLEDITHPRIRMLTAERWRSAPADAVVVHDVPLLVELGYEDRYHLVVVVHADADERVRRLVDERGSTEEDARRRVAAQATDAQRHAAADVWLDNTGAPDDVLTAVDRLWTDRLVPFEAGIRSRPWIPPAQRVSLHEPDPTWPTTARRLAARVRRAGGGRAVRVDHIGSTAVPGLAAKDVIDLQLVVVDLTDADDVATALADAGFPRAAGAWSDTPKPGEAEDPALWQKRFHGAADPARPVHLHVRAAGSPGARYALLFRDWLRAEPAERRGYEALKRRLAEEHPWREGYAAAKEPWFVEHAWPRMQRWAEATAWRDPTTHPDG
ncbi:dephospho-CoA kinase [Aquipuribacter nitratireducens]|uniref:Dephospho-CoA kinase n=1 Tax=Aquipuribacter nitratireducens TaxID=650104 RepID=A0ABW0GI13_9MICO